MIHIIKNRDGHNQFVDFGNLAADQVSELLEIARARSRATCPSVDFPEDSDEETVKYTKLVAPRRFFNKNGEYDLSNPKVMPFKVLGKEILDEIASDTQAELTAKLTKIEAEEAKAIAKAKERGEDPEEDDYKDTHARGKVERRQKTLDAFKKAAKVLA